MQITDPRINKYIAAVMPSRDRVLTEMEAFAAQDHFPIIGPLVGPFLRQLAVAVKAKRVFELGSGFGYSAYWFAGGMKKGGKIILTDGSNENRRKAMSYLKKGRFKCSFEFHVGDALEIFSQYKGPFDIVLNDIDKEGYPDAFDLAIPRLRPGGLFITDNVLWSGRILNKKPDKTSRAILEFNRKLFNSEDIISTIIPIRDGLGIAVKL